MSAVRAVAPLFMVLLGAHQLAGQDAALAVGDRAPRVVVHDLGGKPVDLGQYIGAKPVFLEFWATWCESCRELQPRVRAAQEAYGSKVEFIGINVAVNQSPGGVRQYRRRMSLVSARSTTTREPAPEPTRCRPHLTSSS